MSKTIMPSMVMDFLNYVITHSNHYVFNIKYSNHIVFDYRDFYAYLVYEAGVKVSISEVAGVFKMYVVNYISELMQRGVINNYWIEKVNRNRKMRMHVILNVKTNPVPTVDTTITNAITNTKPQP